MTFQTVNFNENHLLTVMHNLLSALKFLHSANVLHRDIKPSNILVDERGQIRICDLGLARSLPLNCLGESSGNSIRVRNAVIRRKRQGQVNEAKLRDQITGILDKRRPQARTKKRSLTVHIGTRWYRAPEVVLLEKQYDFASDIWSLGCTLAELARAVSSKKETAGDGPNAATNRLFALFPGDSCAPMSPTDHTLTGSALSKSDMLKLILQA